nr:AraC family transcriptional regulator [Rhizobium sp. Q54]
MNNLPVPIYGLYGERQSNEPYFWAHCETIAARSSTHDWEIKPHRHDGFFQILYIRAGSGDALIEGRRTVLQPPCIVLMPPRVSHGYRFSRDIEGFVITVVADRLPITAHLSVRRENWLQAPRMVIIRRDDLDYLDATVRELAREFEVRRGRHSGLMEALLTTTVLLAGRARMPEGGAAPARSKQGRVDALKALIEARFREHLPAQAYALLLNVSATHLNRIVREVTGMTVHDLVMARVMDEACRALVFSPGSVQQIGESLGFTDPAYFSRCFRKRVGQTPGSYRRMERMRFDRTTE